MIGAVLSFLGLSRQGGIALGLGIAASLAALGAGFVWGNAHATAAALMIANAAADARVDALNASYKGIITRYAAKQKDAAETIEQLNRQIDSERGRAAEAAAEAKEKLDHVPDASLDRPVPRAVLDLLRAQPARR